MDNDNTTLTDDWKPIETAPHDGSTVELLGTNGRCDIGAWYEFDIHFNKAANGISDDVTGEFETEFGEGPFSHWRKLV